MRYFIAIETQLHTTLSGVVMALERRLAYWFAAAECLVRQFHELDGAEYLDIKQREFAQLADLQATLDAQRSD